MPKSWIRGLALLVSTLALGGWAQRAQADHQPIDLVVEVGDPAPGLAAGIVFATLGMPAINANGQIAFFATITDGATFTHETVWAGPPDDLQLVAREDAVSPEPGAADAAPQVAAGTTFVDFGLGAAPTLASTGRLAFDASLSVPGDDAVFVHDIGSGDLDVLIREGDEPPGLPGVAFSLLKAWVYNDAGIAVHAELTGTGITFLNDLGIWTGTPAGLTELLRLGDPSPYYGGTSYVAGFDSFVAGKSFTMNPAGQTAFLTSDYHTGLFSYISVIYAGVPGSLTKIAATGENSPVAGCTFFSSTQSGMGTSRLIGASGTVTFYNNVECPTNYRAGLFQGGPGGVQTVVTKEESVGFGGATWGGIWEFPVGGGDVLAVGGTLAGGTGSPPVTSTVDDEVVYAGTAGALSLFARQGQAAPGTADDFDNLDPPQVDASGRVVMSAVLAGGLRGIWAGTPGYVHLVAVGGGTYGSGSRSRTLTDGPDDFYDLANFGTGNADGVPSAISDNGQIVFRSEATPVGGGTARDGIFLTKLLIPAVPIPAPALGLLAAALLAAAFLVRRKTA